MVAEYARRILYFATSGTVRSSTQTIVHSDCVKPESVRIRNEIGNRQWHNGRRQATCANLKLQSRQTNIQEDSYGRQREGEAV